MNKSNISQADDPALKAWRQGEAARLQAVQDRVQKDARAFEAVVQKEAIRWESIMKHQHDKKSTERMEKAYLAEKSKRETFPPVS
jgi:hypothetical protein